MNNQNQTPEKKGFAASFQNKYFRIGGYSTLITVAVIAVAVLINLIVGKLPANITKPDTSSNGIYTLSDQTKEIVRALNDDITIYLIASTGSEDGTISELIDRYAALNSRIRIVKVDPVLNPNFTAAYSDSSVPENSLIIESSRRSKIVENSDIYVVSYSMGSNYSIQTSTSFAGESAVTSALDYVCSDEVARLYVLTGHGEAALGDAMKGYIGNDNVDIRDLSLLASDGVPADASCLLVNAPTTDISAEEAEMILTYLKNGGAAILITGYTDGSPMPHLFSIGEYYGIEAHNGLVVEGGSNNYYRYPYYLLPKVGSHEIVSSLSSDNFYTLLPYAMGLTAMETMPRTSLKVTPLLYTTASAYLKTGTFETVEKADGDLQASFSVAMAASESKTKLVWFTSPYIVDENIDQAVSGGNSTFFLASLTWMCGKASSVAIATKSMQVAALVMTEAESTLWSVIVVGVLPVAILGAGLYVWSKRRKR